MIRLPGEMLRPVYASALRRVSVLCASEHPAGAGAAYNLRQRLQYRALLPGDRRTKRMALNAPRHAG